MNHHPPAEPRPHPVKLSPKQQAIYHEVCNDFPSGLIEFLNHRSFQDMDHMLRTIAYWVTITYPAEDDSPSL